MTEPLTPEGYEQTKEKLRDLETRLMELDERTELEPDHRTSVRRSYKAMIRQYREEIKVYEARQSKDEPMAQT